MKTYLMLIIFSCCMCCNSKELPIRNSQSMGINDPSERILEGAKYKRPFSDPNNAYYDICFDMAHWNGILPKERAILDIQSFGGGSVSRGGNLGWIHYDSVLLPEPCPRIIIWETGDLYCTWQNSVFYTKIKNDRIKELKDIYSNSFFNHDNIYCNGIYGNIIKNHKVSIRLDNKYISSIFECDWWRDGLTFFSPVEYKNSFDVAKPMDKAWFDLISFLDSIDSAKAKIYLLDITAIAFGHFLEEDFLPKGKQNFNPKIDNGKEKNKDIFSTD